MADIKTTLKEAREALKNKNFAVAVKQCQIILDQDADHYMALVLMGAALQDSDSTKAATFLRKAVKQPNNNLAVALQGLSLCAEPKEIPDICRQLLELQPDRYDDVFNKLVKAAANLRQMVSDVAPFVEILHSAVQSPDTAVERRNSALQHLARLYVTNNGCQASAEWKPMFLDALQYACTNPNAASAELFTCSTVSSHVVLYRAYLKMLYTLGADKHRELLQAACTMFSLYPDERYPLECICNVFVERLESTDDFCTSEWLLQPIGEYARTLVAMSPRSTTGLMASAIDAFGDGQFVQAKSLLIRLYGIQCDWDICVIWLVRTLLQLAAPEIAEALLRRMPVNDVLLVECLVAQPDKADKVSEAIALCRSLLTSETVDDATTTRLLFALAQGLVAAGQFELIDQTATQLDELNAPQLATIVRALLHLQQGNAAAAIELLSVPLASGHSSQHLLLLGRANLALGQSSDALGHFLAATKMSPCNSDCFYWLAQVYHTNAVTGRPRAIKCLQKCVLLNERHQAATTLLVGLHMEDQAHEALELLLGVTVADPIADLMVPCSWVWLLLGTHRQRAGRFNDAVTAFRVALREHPADVRCWMGLADTYRERGSLQSALKVYQKCIEMKDAYAADANASVASSSTQIDDEYVYAQLQVACLKSAIGLHAEAVVEFGVLLAAQPDFVPGLKGVAEAHLGLAQGFAEQKLFGRARQHAAEAVTVLTHALRHRNDFAILWRMLATALTFVARLAQALAHLEVSAQLTNRPGATADQTVRLLGPELHALAANCLSRALKIRPTDVLLWYDLALNYYQRAQKLNGADTAAKRRQHLVRADAAARYAVQLQPARWQNWNLLGVISATVDMDNAALAQHAFIRAVQLCRTAAPAWTNLGVLYATRAGDVRLANRAFGQAQQAQTDYVHSWTGQACLAEQLGQPSEAIDLFQHASGLQYSGESALGFVHWICMALTEYGVAGAGAGGAAVKVDPHMRYVCERMFGPTVALDSIEWYLRAEDDATASTWCFAGYLYYGASMWSLAVRSFERAVQLAQTDDERDKLLFNLGTSLVRAGRPVEAQRVFHAVTGATFDTAIGLATAHQLAEQYEDAYGVYESALQLLAQTDGQRSQTLVAMSAIVYKFQGEQDAKSLLFQCIGLPEPPVEGLFSGCAVGIIHQDMQLSELVLNELQKNRHDARYIHHIAFLTAQFHQKNKRPRKALLYLLSQVHMHPDHVELRKVLANFIMQNTRRSESQLTAASRVAESTIVLQLSNSKRIDSSEQGAKSLAMASEAMRCVDQNRRKLLAQRAVHVNPTCRQAWAALLMCSQ